MKNTALILIALLALTGTMQAAQKYPSMIKSIFVKNCSDADSADAVFCQCIIDGVEKSIPVESFISDLQQFQNDIWKQPGYADVHKSCIAKKAN